MNATIQETKETNIEFPQKASPLWRTSVVIPGLPARQRTGTADEVDDPGSKTPEG